MNHVPDRMKLRREYLKKKGRIYAAAIGVVVAYGGIVLAMFILYRTYLAGNPSMIMGFALLLLPINLIMTLKVAPDLRRRHDARIANLAHVPPVTADVLPAEEVLVRGSEEPAAAIDTLVRPASAGAETSTEELLRSSQVMPDTLPADEILVRGAQPPPVVQSEMLLRAAQSAQATPKEELLRVGNDL